MILLLPISMWGQGDNRHVLVLSSDFIPENIHGLLSIFRSDSKIGPLIARGYLNDRFLIQPEGPPSQKSFNRVGVYASLWTGQWPAQHGVHGLESDQYNFDEFPQIFRHLRELQNPVSSLVISSDDLLGSQLIKGYSQNSFIEVDNTNVKANAVRSISDKPPALIWIHWHFHEAGTSSDGYTTVGYRTANSFKQILNSVWERDSFPEEDWLIVILGLPIAGTSPDLQAQSHGFAIIDSVGSADPSRLILPAAVDLAPLILSHLDSPPRPQVADLPDNSQNPPASSGPKPIVIQSQNIPQTAATLEDLARKVEKLSLAYQIDREQHQRNAQQQATAMQENQDKLTYQIMNLMSNRLAQVEDLSKNYRTFSGTVMDQSVQLALTVIVIMMVICMATFIITTIIQTRNSRQLAQIMQSFAAYRSRQFHKELADSDGRKPAPSTSASAAVD